MKKFISSLLFLASTTIGFSQQQQAITPFTTSIFNTMYSESSGIGTTTPSSHGKGYIGLTVNSPINGGFIDFQQTNSTRGSILGDSKGLSLEGAVGYGLHLWSNGKENMTFLTNGFVGLGTTAPVGKLDVFGTFLSGGKSANISTSNTTTGDLSYMAATGKLLIGWNRSAGQGETDFIANQGNGSNGGFAFYKIGDNSTTNTVSTELLRILGTGQVLIGTKSYSPKLNIGQNMLAVSGGVITESVTVKTQNNWPDYVLASKYNLEPLALVKNYILANHHLPDMPSANEISKKGQNIGLVNEVLVKKVEELTLYLIQKDEQVKGQEKQIADQKNQLTMQEQQIKKLQDAVSKLISEK